MFRGLLLWAFALVLPQGLAADPVAQVFYRWQDGTATVATTKDGLNAQTPFAIASIGKTMTAVAVLRLVQQGEIGLDDAAAAYLSDDVVDGIDGLEQASLRHLLTMTSGLVDYYDDSFVEAAISRTSDRFTAEDAAAFAFDAPALFAPGEGFDYSNTNYLLLGRIIENVTGLTYGQAMAQLVLKPAGMRSAFVFGGRALPQDFPTGHEDGHVRDYYLGQGFGDGGVISSAADLSAFYQALFVERTLLSERLLDEMLEDPLGEGYGMGIVVGGGIYGHTGGDLGFSSEVVYDEAQNVIAIALVAEGDGDTSWVETALE